MRPTYAICNRKSSINLIAAAQQLLDVIQSGEMFADDPERQHRAVAAADALEACATVLRGTLLESCVGNESPFAAYRHEILGHYSTARRLQELVLHLWNDCNPLYLASLFMNADERHTRIALELIASYTTHGENDPHFMNLAAEIRDLHLMQKKVAA